MVGKPASSIEAQAGSGESFAFGVGGIRLDEAGENAEDRKKILSSITYLENQKGRMKYSYSVERNWPIGSGVTEAACKTLIKHRLCNRVSRWKDDGALAVLSIRGLRLTPGRWQEFWRNIDQYGCPTLPA